MKDKINIIGRGNVASHLFHAFQEKKNPILVNPHTLEEFDTSAPLTIISVSDGAIEEVIGRLPSYNGVLAHTSGSTSIKIFENKGIDHFGVFYPMQTFSKGKKLDYSKIPFFIEASDPDSLSLLKENAMYISENIREITSEQRKNLHIAAVLSCNFVNHLWTLTDDYLRSVGLQFSDMLPLIEETVGKIKELTPKEAQTGPAAREDYAIINEHLEALSANPKLRDIYSLLSNSIIAHHQINPMLENLKKYHILLASKSPRRRELLAELRIPFNPISLGGIDESYPDNIPSEDVPQYLADRKADAYLSVVKNNEMVITADTLVIKDDRIYGKPHSAEEANEMLKELSDSTHKVVTGVCIVTMERRVSFTSSTDVHFSKISDEDANYYIENFQPFDKAGAYGIQEWIGCIAVDWIKGSFYNVMGLPIHRLYQELKLF